MLFAAKKFFGGGGSGVGTLPDKRRKSAGSGRQAQDDNWPEEFDEYGNAVAPTDTPKQNSKTSPQGKQSIRDFFKDGVKQKGKDYAFNKGKDFLKNTETGKKVSKYGSDLFNKLDEKTGGKASKFKNAIGAPGVNKEELKAQAKDYIKGEGKQEIKKFIGDKIGSGAKKGVKEGTEKLAQKATKEAVEVGTKAVVKGGTKLAGESVVVGGIDAAAEALGAAGIAGGPAVILTEILAQLVVIAISLGISDAIDGTFALAGGHVKEAMHLFVRAATKIVVFVVWLVLFIICVGIIPVVGFIIPLVLINMYWALSAIPFVKDMAVVQGLVWWEKILIVGMNVVAVFVVSITIFTALYVYCNIGSLIGASTGVVGGATVGGLIDTASTSKGSFCSAFQNLGVGAGGDSGGGTVSGSGDVTAAGYVPQSDSCGGDPSKLCKANFPNSRCTPEVIARCQSPEYTTIFNEGLNMYRQNGGTGITGLDMLTLVKSIASVERGCTRTGACSGASACGMMQFIPDSAIRYARRCGTTMGNWPGWANENPAIQVCMAAFHLQDNSTASLCGTQVRNIAAGYNAGPGNCQRNTSSGCNVSSCDGTSPLRKWECKCGRATANYNETTFYGPAVSGCYYNAFK